VAYLLKYSKFSPPVVKKEEIWPLVLPKFSKFSPVALKYEEI